ncbi:hypothetical protein TNCV_908761 [Trichonephila clavipes]|nr:hypothetical protein TNCV_908761 [Trichonephila clavipes]
MIYHEDDCPGKERDGNLMVQGQTSKKDGTKSPNQVTVSYSWPLARHAASSCHAITSLVSTRLNMEALWGRESNDKQPATRFAYELPTSCEEPTCSACTSYLSGADDV